MKIDLANMLPISKAAASLASLLRRSEASGDPMIITQKGRPTGVVLSLAAYEQLRQAAERGAAAVAAAAGREA